MDRGVHDRLHIYPLCGIFYFPWHRHPIEGINGVYSLIRKTQRYTICNVESQVFTPNNAPGPGIETRPAVYQADVLTTTVPRASVQLHMQAFRTVSRCVMSLAGTLCQADDEYFAV